MRATAVFRDNEGSRVYLRFTAEETKPAPRLGTRTGHPARSEEPLPLVMRVTGPDLRKGEPGCPAIRRSNSCYVSKLCPKRQEVRSLGHPSLRNTRCS